MNLERIFAVVILLGVLSTGSSAQETQQPATPPAAKPGDAPPKPADATPKPADATKPAPQGAARETPPAPPSASAPKKGVVNDGEFIPTQEINPDEDVTFPVDI